MKKIIAIVCAAVLCLSMAACGSKPASSTPASSTQQLTAKPETELGKAMLKEFGDKIASGKEYTAESLAEELAASETLPFMGASMPVEEGFLNGFSDEIKGFKEGAMFGPMIGSIPCIGYVFTVENAADVAAFEATLKEKADLRWNICTAADEMVCDHLGSTVFFLMCPAQFEE